jgi:ABC-type methionine transport system ATPase subunit
LRLDGTEVGEDGRSELPELRRSIGMIFQHFNLLKSKPAAET